MPEWVHGQYLLYLEEMLPLVAASVLLPQGLSTQPASDEMQSLFQLLDAVGIGRTMSGRLVELFSVENGKRVARWTGAVGDLKWGTGPVVLVGLNPKEITYFGFDEAEVATDPRKEWEWRRVDLATAGPAHLAQLKRTLAKAKKMQDSFGASFLDPAMWSRYAALHGQARLARQYFDLARSELNHGPLVPVVREYLSDKAYAEIVGVGVLRKGSPWNVTQEKLQRFLRLYPREFHSQNARSLLAAIDTMQRKNPIEPSGGEIGGLIRSLSDDWPRNQGFGPAAMKLIHYGTRAVPQLIDALTDESPTHYGADFERMLFEHFTQPVLRVGDVASSIISEIAHKDFHTSAWYDKYVPIKDRDGDKRRAIHAWWVDTQRRGPNAPMVDSIRALDNDAFTSFPALYKVDPNLALTTLRRAIASAKEIPPTTPDLLRDLKTPPARQLARDLMSHPQPWVRINAARVVAEFDPDAGAKILGKEWPREDVTEQLAGIRSLVAVRCFAAKLALAPAKDRAHVPDSYEYWMSDLLEDARKHPRSGDRLYFKEVEGLLTRMLADKAPARLTFVDGQRDGGPTFEPARISDVAAKALARLDPRKYPFKIHRTASEMDAMEHQFMTTWRSRLSKN